MLPAKRFWEIFWDPTETYELSFLAHVELLALHESNRNLRSLFLAHHKLVLFMREHEKSVNSSSLAHDLRHHCEGSLGGRGDSRTGCLTYCSLFFLAEARARCLSSALFHLTIREVKVSKLLKRMRADTKSKGPDQTTERKTPWESK